MQITIFILFILFVLFIIYSLTKKKKPLLQPVANVERKILQEHVVFYQKLNEDEKVEFEKRVQGFLKTVRIKGVETEIEDMDKVFVAAAAIIPIFAFKDWEHRNIHYVLI